MSAREPRLDWSAQRQELSSLLLRAATRAAGRCFERARELGREVAGAAGTGVLVLTQSEAVALVQALEGLADAGRPLDDEQLVLLGDLRELAFTGS